ncbi:MAG: helix-turn-helix domain-containing protein [Terriglobia bacterium]
MVNFGERLRLLRGQRSQKRVAEEIGIPPTTLSTFENQESPPRVEMLDKLADYYGVQISYFFPADTPKPSEAARSHLLSLRRATGKAQGVLTHSTLDLDDEKQQKVLEVMRRKNAEASNK